MLFDLRSQWCALNKSRVHKTLKPEFTYALTSFIQRAKCSSILSFPSCVSVSQRSWLSVHTWSTRSVTQIALGHSDITQRCLIAHIWWKYKIDLSFFSAPLSGKSRAKTTNLALSHQWICDRNSECYLVLQHTTSSHALTKPSFRSAHSFSHGSTWVQTSLCSSWIVEPHYSLVPDVVRQ